MGRARGQSHAVTADGFAGVFGERRGSGRDPIAARNVERLADATELLRQRLGVLDFDGVVTVITDTPELMDEPDIRGNVLSLIEFKRGPLYKDDAAAGWMTDLACLPHSELTGPLASHVESAAAHITPWGRTENAIMAIRLLEHPANDTWSAPLRTKLAERMAADACEAGDEMVEFVNLLVARPDMSELTSAVATGFRSGFGQRDKSERATSIAGGVCRRAIDTADAQSVEQLGDLVDAFCEGVTGNHFLHPIHPIQAATALFGEADAAPAGTRVRQIADTLTEVFKRGGPAAEGRSLLAGVLTEEPAKRARGLDGLRKAVAA